MIGEPLERALEAGARKRLGLETDFFVRSEKEWQRSRSRHNPFARQAAEDPGHLLRATFLRTSPTRKSVDALAAAIVGRESVRVAGRLAYIVYPDGVGRSRLTPAILDKHLGRGTARNWNTVLKVEGLTGG